MIGGRLRAWFGALSPRDRRALLTGALALTPILVLNQVVRPAIRARADLATRLIRERDLLRREERLLGGESSQALAFTRDESRLLALSSSLFPGADLVAASSALGTYVNGLAYEHRVMVQRSEAIPPSAAASRVARLGLEIQGVSDLEGILTLLHQLERGRKLVTVDRLSIAAATALDRESPAEALTFAATLSAYALVDSSLTEVSAR